MKHSIPNLKLAREITKFIHNLLSQVLKWMLFDVELYNNHCHIFLNRFLPNLMHLFSSLTPHADTFSVYLDFIKMTTKITTEVASQNKCRHLFCHLTIMTKTTFSFVLRGRVPNKVLRFYLKTWRVPSLKVLNIDSCWIISPFISKMANWKVGYISLGSFIS